MSDINKIMNFLEESSIDEYYKRNDWIIINCPKYKDLSKEEKNKHKLHGKTINFNQLNTDSLITEFKSFFYYLIEILGLVPITIYSKANSFDMFIGFINSKYPNIKSISEISKKKYMFEFRDYSIANGFKEIVTVERLTANMEMKSYGTITTRVAFIKQLYEYLYPENTHLEEKEKDKWDIRNLDIKIEIQKSRPRYTINFESIKQEYLRKLAKKYIYHRLQVRKLSTVFDDMKGIKYLSKFIEQDYSKIKTLKHVDREFIEGLIGYIKTSKLSKRISAQRIGQINTFFDAIILMKLEDAPIINYIIDSDYRGKHSSKVEYYSDGELSRINSCMKDMPIDIARMLYVIESIGLRINELSQLKKNNLLKVDEENYVLRYYQEKTANWNTIPINNEVAMVLKKSIESSNEEYGESCKYIFPINSNKPISVDTFSYVINEALYKNKILDDEGKPLRAKAHSFRRTLATKYINMSVEPDMIALMLGQKSIKSLKHYIEIHDDTMIEHLRPITKKQNEMISNIGNCEYFNESNKELNIEDSDKLLPLSNGFCLC